MRDCLQALGLPLLTTADDLAKELPSYRLKWSLDRTLHARLDYARSHFDAGFLRSKLKTLENTPTEAGATMVVEIPSEAIKSHTGCRDDLRRHYVTAHANLEAAQPPGAGTIANSLGLGLNLVDPIAEAVAGFIQATARPSAEATLIVEQHVPDRFASRRAGRAAPVCAPLPPRWTGSVSGTLQDGMITETFSGSVTYATDQRTDDGFGIYAITAGTIEWSISGSDGNCSYDGHASFQPVGRLDVTDVGDTPTYGITLTGDGRSYPVTVTCAAGTTAQQMQPFKGSYRFDSDTQPYQAGQHVGGNRSYTETHSDGQSLGVAFSWDLSPAY